MTACVDGIPIPPMSSSPSENRAPGEPAIARRDVLFLAGIVLLSLALRVYGIRSWPLDQDELYTLRDASDFGARSSSAGITARPLYYLLQHALLAITPRSAGWLRVMPLAFGLLGIMASYLLARRLFGGVAGVVAALAVAVSPWHLYASQFARYWSLVYLLACLGILAVWNAREVGTPRRWLLALVTLWLGTLTHPTFVFPLVGAIGAMHVVSRDGRFTFSSPSPDAWRFCWLPLVGLVSVSFALSKMLSPAGQFGNGVGRGAVQSVGVFLGMVQWLSAEVVAMTGIAIVGMLLSARDRRWGSVVLAGATTMLVILAFASFENDIYADYGMASLPLMFATLGGAAQRLTECTRTRAAAWATCALVVAASLPASLSHLSDGSRFEYRPAIESIRESGRRRPLLAWPLIVARYYAPELAVTELLGTREQFEEFSRRGGFDVIVSHARNGVRVLDDQGLAWLDVHCRVRQRTTRPRLDYRSYRVDLWTCDGAT